MSNLFGLEWTSSVTNSPLGVITKFSNKYFSDIFVTEQALEDDLHELPQDDFYIILSILREYYLQKKTILICQDKKPDLLTFRNGNIVLMTIDDFKSIFPNKLIDKQNRFLLNLSMIHPEYGVVIENINIYDGYSKDFYELNFLLNILEEKGLIENGFSLASGGRPLMKNGILLKEKAWIEIEKNSTKMSKQAFIAMWFDPEMDEAFLKIEKACDSNGFKAFRIDTKEHNNEISGEILYEIRNSKFLISEVTGQRQGVYFEAGYAMALGLPVIWCCRENELGKVHFDTRQYNHVIWNNFNELETKLANRIKGTIR